MAEPGTVVEWISAARAAEILGISKRRVLEYVQAGALQSRRQRDVNTRQMAVQVGAGDVERLREERENPQPQPPRTTHTTVTTDGITVRYEAGGVRRGAPRALPQAIAELARELPPSELARKLWLTESEAVRYTGLGRGYIAGKLQPGRIGPRGALVYRRADLEGL